MRGVLGIDRTRQMSRLKLVAHVLLSYILHHMIKFDRAFLFYKLPPVLYATCILTISAIPNAAPPSLGFTWEDKIYHGIEYFLFSLLVFRAFHRLPQSPRLRVFFWFIISFGFLFGALDEIVQYFIPSRNCSFADWLADAGGYLAGGYLIMRRRMKGASRKLP